jgi:hypothetical protein
MKNLKKNLEYLSFSEAKETADASQQLRTFVSDSVYVWTSGDAWTGRNHDDRRWDRPRGWNSVEPLLGTRTTSPFWLSCDVLVEWWFARLLFLLHLSTDVKRLFGLQWGVDTTFAHFASCGLDSVEGLIVLE